MIILDDALNSDDCKGSWNPKIDILIQFLSTTRLVVRHQTTSQLEPQNYTFQYINILLEPPPYVRRIL